MNIQIFGIKKSFDSKKAERFFKERGIKCYILLLNSPQTLENLCVNPLFRTGDNLTGNFKEEYNTY